MKWRILSSAPLIAAIVLAGGGAHASAQSRDQMIVTTQWLKQHLNDRELVLLHVGEKPGYDVEHIPGARFITMQDVAAPRVANVDAGESLELPTPEAARAKLESLGISDNSRIIVYYGKDWVTPSTRVVFTLDWLGLGNRTSLLDGGMQAWKSAGGAVTAELPAITAARLSAKPVKDVVVTREWVNANRGKSGITLIDARAAAFYDGVNPSMKKKGHIPGAKNIPFTTITDDSLKLNSPEKLRDLFDKAGYKPGDTVAVYCHIGQQGTAVVFAARSLGYKVVLYDGSFHNWEKSDLPVEDPSVKKE
jgi:thiosulfate/3-mercaptopyruvate sulfurtransferase